MARVTVEDCLKDDSNRFSLVHLASRRAKDLIRGKKVEDEIRPVKPLVTGYDNKAAVTALREIAAGHVSWKENVEELLRNQGTGNTNNIF